MHIQTDTSINTEFNPLLQADVFDADADVVYCELWTNASGSWQIVNSNVFTTGSGAIQASLTGLYYYAATVIISATASATECSIPHSSRSTVNPCVDKYYLVFNL